MLDRYWLGEAEDSPEKLAQPPNSADREQFAMGG
jgi:hypothetical protein